MTKEEMAEKRNERARQKWLADGHCTNIEAHKKFKIDGVKIAINTINKIVLKSIYISGAINLKSSKDEEKLKEISSRIKKIFQNWVIETDYLGDKVLFIINNATDFIKKYTAKNKNITFECHCSVTKQMSYIALFKLFSKDVDNLMQSIVNAVNDVGLELNEFKGYNSSQYKKEV